MVPSDSSLNDEANKRSLAANGHLGAEKSQLEKLYICCPFSHNCKCWWNVGRLLADCWPNASQIGVDVFIKNAKSKTSSLTFFRILMGKTVSWGFSGAGNPNPASIFHSEIPLSRYTVFFWKNWKFFLKILKIHNFFFKNFKKIKIILKSYFSPYKN